MGLTTDRNDPDLGHGSDEKPTDQNKKYLVLSEDEKAKGFIRPVRQSYVHIACGEETKMNMSIAETYARDPKFYGLTYCICCRMHKPVDQFVWKGTDQKVGS